MTAPLRPASVAVVFGTRPEIVKLAPVIHALGPAAFVIHTGQHYDEEMSDVFLAQHAVPDPAVWLTAGGRTRSGQVAHIIDGLDRIFAERRLSAVVVQGDTNSTLAGALAANAHNIPIVHVEAGLRSFDRAMPEEHNRVLTDHLADLLCAATAGNVNNLLVEAIPQSRIHLTGNTVAQSVAAQLPAPMVQLDVVEGAGLQSNGYVLATLHRPENTDDPDVLRAILTELAHLPLPVALPLHPRTAAAAAAAGCADLLDQLRVLPPLPSSTFLALAAHAAVLVSDSGGLQEECTVLKRPLVVVRRSTERPESLTDFARLVSAGPEVGLEVRRILGDHAALLARLHQLPSPFGDEFAAARIVEGIAELVGRTVSPEGSLSRT
ncbi:UDP-N-acetylglucosamine 2-epimerase (non-hydrolyzing) [Jatrophihabitans sp.]|uniref:non-hydrolyzing UDP-N-acetylglucosamine 2-epimerase n=1 Tax=Jatrophihabitans sp. TaxID=1932789 RepID=UPI0030C659F3|nr:UDP-N-acetylglucosamine 2-epimerase [Jatrophihabitans sp.]